MLHSETAPPEAQADDAGAAELHHGDRVATLRVMATSDLHMNLTGWDYARGCDNSRFGLARVATLIARERAGAQHCLLFDNGDALHGSPLADTLTDHPETGPHPMIAAMTRLGYDAITLGNHDFDDGLTRLCRVLATPCPPVTVANARPKRGDAPWVPHLLLDRAIMLDDGQTAHLRIGVAGFLPPQTVAWDRNLARDLECRDIVEAAREASAALRAQGADLVIALAHTGIGAAEAAPLMENAAAALARLGGFDLIIAGHTHQAFPAPDFPRQQGVDSHHGRVEGVPTIMAGFWGSHLAIADLRLGHAKGRWHLRGVQCRAEPAAGLPASELVNACARSTHRATLRRNRMPVTQAARALHSYFTFCGRDDGAALIAQSMRWYARHHPALSGDHRPIVAAIGAFRAGGRAGPDHFSLIPPGPVRRGNLAELYPFSNRICALATRGTDVLDWLERAASAFAHIQPDTRDVDLLDPRFPSYLFDIMAGAEYEIDLTQPPRFEPDGTLRHPSARRITNLRIGGKPVAPEDEIVVMSNSYRLSGCGLYRDASANHHVIFEGPDRVRDILQRACAARPEIAPPERPIWRFKNIAGASARLRTSPAASGYLHEIAGLEAVGLDGKGFLVCRYHLDTQG